LIWLISRELRPKAVKAASLTVLLQHMFSGAYIVSLGFSEKRAFNGALRQH
jgi:hypothetical protein